MTLASLVKVSSCYKSDNYRIDVRTYIPAIPAVYMCVRLYVFPATKGFSSPFRRVGCRGHGLANYVVIRVSTSFCYAFEWWFCLLTLLHHGNSLWMAAAHVYEAIRGRRRRKEDGFPSPHFFLLRVSSVSLGKKCPCFVRFASVPPCSLPIAYCCSVSISILKNYFLTLCFHCFHNL